MIPDDFRRTAIRALVRAGVSEAVGMKMCGQETRNVFDHYNITTGDDLRAAATKLDGAAESESRLLREHCEPSFAAVRNNT